MSIPGHVIFLAIISSLKAGHTSTTARFFCMYILAGFVQVSLATERHNETLADKAILLLTLLTLVLLILRSVLKLKVSADRICPGTLNI